MRAVAALAILFLVPSCQAPPPEMTDAEKAQIEAELMEVTDALTEAWNAWDIDASMSFLHPERTSFAWAGTVYDFDGLRERYSEVWAGADRQETAWTTRKVEVLSEDAVFFQGSFELRIFYSDGREVLYPGTCHWTGLYEPYNGEWKMTYGSYAYGGAQTVEGG
jgi:hypothetical protein